MSTTINNFIPYGTDPELDEIIDKKGINFISIKVAIAEQGYGLDRLIDDPYEDVREAVAKQGYGLERLIHDTSVKVCREAVKVYIQNKFHNS